MPVWELWNHCVRFKFNVIVFNAVIDAYGKCGELDTSYSIFSQMQERNVVTWTSMVVAYSQTSMLEDVFQSVKLYAGENVHTWTALINSFVSNKYRNEALDLFEQMLEEKISPNDLTFVGF